MAVQNVSTFPNSKREASSEAERRGLAAQEKVKRGQVSRARQALVGAALSPKTEETLEELRRRRPQAVLRQIPQEVMDYAPDSPLAMDIWLKPFWLKAVVAKARSADCLYHLLHPCQPVRSMVRRGWSQLDVPTGWVQIVRGPRPKSVTWPRADNQPTKPQVASAKPPGGQRRPGVAPQTRPRLSPEAVVEVSLSKVAKLEKALEVLGDREGPVYEAMQAELKRARSAAQLQPASVRLEQCRSFIERAKI